MTHTNNLADYHEIKLAVRYIADGAFSFSLACYCQTPGVPTSIEPCPIRVTVNYYKFKAWITQRDWITDFEGWKLKYNNTAHFYNCLTDYINDLQGRTLIYVPQTETSKRLDSLIIQAKELTHQMQQYA